MRVTHIDVIPFSIPLRVPNEFASGHLRAAEHALVTVETDDGIAGHAEAIPRPMVYGETMASLTWAIESIIAPAWVGLDLTCTEVARHRLRHLVGNPSARSSVEIAVFDALGKTLGHPCYRLLGGYRSLVECAGILHLGTPEEVVSEALQLSEDHGIGTFKVKVGLELDRDVATVALLRRELGSQTTLYCDGNGGFSVDETLRFARSTEAYGLTCLEEPCRWTSTGARAAVSRHSPIAILGDESCGTYGSVVDSLNTGNCSMVSVKPTRTGVITSSQIIAFCEEMGADVIIGSQGESAIGMVVAGAVAGATEFAGRRAAELSYYLGLEEQLTTSVPAITNGQLQLPDSPGFGIEIDSVKLAKYRLR